MIDEQALAPDAAAEAVGAYAAFAAGEPEPLLELLAPRVTWFLSARRQLRGRTAVAAHLGACAAAGSATAPIGSARLDSLVVLEFAEPWWASPVVRTVGRLVSGGTLACRMGPDGIERIYAAQQDRVDTT